MTLGTASGRLHQRHSNTDGFVARATRVTGTATGSGGGGSMEPGAAIGRNDVTRQSQAKPTQSHLSISTHNAPLIFSIA